MASADHLNTYAEGWTKGDAAIIISSLDDGYKQTIPTPERYLRESFPTIWLASNSKWNPHVETPAVLSWSSLKLLLKSKRES